MSGALYIYDVNYKQNKLYKEDGFNSRILQEKNQRNKRYR